MKHYNFRFKNDPKNQNIGLRIEEIDILQKELNLEFPEVFIFYLQKAGKNSNVFPVETRTKELVNIQEELKNQLDNLNTLQDNNILCISKKTEYKKYFDKEFESYYFFNLSENRYNPRLYIFEEKCINEGWNAFQKRITKPAEENFVDFINERTKEKYGLTIKQHAKNIPLYIVSVPVSIILLIILRFRTLKGKK